MHRDSRSAFVLVDDLSHWPVFWTTSIALLLSASFALVFYSLWPKEILIDDGAIVLRYLDNAAAGGFYRYNLQDGPVFGVSGFVHGALAGALAASHWATPEQSALWTNLLGVSVSAFAVLLILRRSTASALVVLVSWVFVLSACYFFLTTAFAGLEAPLHMGIVLLAVWAFLADRPRAMWALLALAMISKLDAAPVVVVLAGLRLGTLLARGESRRGWRAVSRAALVYDGIPLRLWILFASWFFGSPLPQSAYAKLNYHYHPPSRIEFVTSWWRRDELRIIAYWATTFAAVAVSVWKSRREQTCGLLALPLACLGVLGLFVVVNPGERMPWYYVIPQALMVIGAVTSLLSLVRPVREPWRTLVPVGILILAIPTTVATAHRSIDSAIHSIRSAEPERIEIGIYIRDHADPKDELLTSHGHIACAAGLYTHDFSGLNSPIVTNLLARGLNPLDELKPKWFVRPGLLSPSNQRQLGYSLAATFYGRATHGRPAWRVWTRTQDGVSTALAVIEDEVAADGEVRPVIDNPRYISNLNLPPPDPGRPDHGLRIQVRRRVQMTYAGDGQVAALRLGIVRQRQQMTLWVSIGSDDDDPVAVVVPGIEESDLAFGQVWSADIPVLNDRTDPTRVVLSHRGATSDLELLEPVWMVVFSDQVLQNR